MVNVISCIFKHRREVDAVFNKEILDHQVKSIVVPKI